METNLNLVLNNNLNQDASGNQRIILETLDQLQRLKGKVEETKLKYTTLQAKQIETEEKLNQKSEAYRRQREREETFRTAAAERERELSDRIQRLERENEELSDQVQQAEGSANSSQQQVQRAARQANKASQVAISFPPSLHRQPPSIFTPSLQTVNYGSTHPTGYNSVTSFRFGS